MSIERVREYFKTLGIEDKILEFDVSSATVPLAALALGTEEARIAKSLSFIVEDKAIIIVTAGTARINNKRYKEIFHKKAKMLSPEQVTELIGHRIGGAEEAYGINRREVIKFARNWSLFEGVDLGAFGLFLTYPFQLGRIRYLSKRKRVFKKLKKLYLMSDEQRRSFFEKQEEFFVNL